MSPTELLIEVNKFEEILKLSRLQMAYLKVDDYESFDTILAKKGAIIATLVNARLVTESSDVARAVSDQIRLQEDQTYRVLYQKTGKIMGELSKIQNAKNVRAAYRATRFNAKAPVRTYVESQPRFIDIST